MSLRYTPLDPGKAQIRVLTLQIPDPSTTQTSETPRPLTCSVSIISMNDDPTFIALSYVWGTVTAAQPILVDGSEVIVTQSLYDALSWYLTWRPNIPIWADAICIDQENLEEKNHQVRLMSRIYQEAINVLCWLGPSTPRIDLYLEMGYELPNAWVKSPWLSRKWKWLKLCSKIWYAGRSEYRVILTILKVLNGQAELGELPYFKRIWTFQEMMLPKSKAIFVLGGRITARDLTEPIFVPMPRFIRTRAFRLAMIDHSLSRLVWGEILGPGFFGLTLDHSRVISRIAAMGISPVTNLLIGTAHRACHDPRDKVFGILGLLNHRGDADAQKTDAQYKYLAVDYTKEVENVVLDALYYTHHHERSSKLPHILAQYECCSINAFQTGLPRLQGSKLPSPTRGPPFREYPSWLPDMLHSRYGFGPRIALTTSGEAFINWHKLKTEKIEHNILDFKGKLVGHVQNVFAFPEPTIDIMTTLRALRENGMLLQRSSKDNPHREIFTPREFEKRAEIERDCQQFLLIIKSRERLWDRVREATDIFRPPVHHQIWGMEEANLYEDTRWTETSPSAEWIRIHQEEKADSLRGQALFILDTGRFGFCAANVRVGDLAIMSNAWGTSRGWLLIRRDEAAEELFGDNMNDATSVDVRGRFYQMVERPYVDGMLEAKDNDYLNEIKLREDERFFLV